MKPGKKAHLKKYLPYNRKWQFLPVANVNGKPKPEPATTTCDGNGGITDGPRRYVNLISTAPASEFPINGRAAISLKTPSRPQRVGNNKG